MKNDADVLVIGASPAGISAALAASAQDIDVTLIERKSGIGDPPHPANTFFQGMFDKTSEVVHSEYVTREMAGAEIVSPGGSRIVVDAPGYIIDRRKFDEYHARELIGQNVDIHTGVTAHNIIKKDKKIQTSTSDRTFTSDIVIIADGISSQLSALAGLHPTKYPHDIAWAVEAEVEADGIGEPDFFEYHVGSIAPGWKATYSPGGGDRANLGVFVRRHGQDVSRFFDLWLERFKKQKDISDLQIIRKYTGGDPIATIPAKIVSAGIMVTGGAAGQSGIGYGMRAGEICGSVAANAIAASKTSVKVLSEYPRLWGKEFGSEYRLGRSSLEALRKMDDKEIDRLVGLFAGEDVGQIVGTGSPTSKAFRVMRFMLRRKPVSALSCLPSLIRAGI
ncbi:MAG: Digeranylgeranylglycerophospholipid reductase [ANME-2 cluster archaeon]|nr:Digeranylgeranylglycerophospholipid reductase [ANME-2 cluster archaeon]